MASVDLEDFVDLRITILRSTSQDRDVGQGFGFSSPMGMSTKDGQLAIGIAWHHFQDGFTHGLAGEMRSPFIVRYFPIVPTGFSQGRYMGDEIDVGMLLQGQG